MSYYQVPLDLLMEAINYTQWPRRKTEALLGVVFTLETDLVRHRHWVLRFTTDGLIKTEMVQEIPPDVIGVIELDGQNALNIWKAVWSRNGQIIKEAVDQGLASLRPTEGINPEEIYALFQITSYEDIWMAFCKMGLVIPD